MLHYYKTVMKVRDYYVCKSKKIKDIIWNFRVLQTIGV